MRWETQEDFAAIAFRGFTWSRTPSAADIKSALPYLPTSENADAWLIGAWLGYWTGKPPKRIRKSRGHTWRVESGNFDEFSVTVKDPFDHRNGVVRA